MRGSLRQRSAGSWDLTVDLGRDPFGKRRRRYVTVRGAKARAQRIEDDTNGGAAHIWSNGSLEPDTLYKYTLMLVNEFGRTVIEKTRIER